MNSRLSRIGSSALVVLLSLGAVVAAAPGASATHQGSFTTRELLDKCNQGKTDKCAFRPTSSSTYTGRYMLAGSGQNCGSGTDTRVVRWEASTSTTNSFGVEMSRGIKIANTFESAVKVSYRRDWSWSESQVDEYRAELGAREKKEIWVAKQRTKVRGDWEINFGKRQKGHYIWYVNQGEVDGQVKGSPWAVDARKVRSTC